MEASGAELRKVCERHLDALDLLVNYVDGVRFGDHQVLGGWSARGASTSWGWPKARAKMR